MYLYTYVFPCSYEEYEKMNENLELQKSFDKYLDTLECKKHIDDQTSIIYLAYKGFLMFSPRDLLFL